MEYTSSHGLGLAIIVAIYAIDLIIRLALLIYIPKNRKPTAAMAWLLFIYIIPVYGTIFFFIIGGTKLSVRRRKAQQQINLLLKRYSTTLKKAGLTAPKRTTYLSYMKLGESLTMLAPTQHNTVAILSGYDELIEEMTEKILAARYYVYVEFYILALDSTTEPFFKALEDAVERGVDVKLLFDAYGSRKYPRYKEMQKRLTSIGVEWRKILPFSLIPRRYNRPDLRNHRKILVVDSSDAYIGSLNVIDKTYHRKDDISYIELAVHMQGPSVNEAAAVFASDWYCETGELLKDFTTTPPTHTKGRALVQLIPSGPGYPYQNNLKMFVAAIQGAQRSVVITNPYLVPDESLLSALISAAQRGVKVSVLNSTAIDQWMVGHAQRSYYTELLRAGVEIYLYKKPQLVHEKFMAIDEEIGIIGSSNLDIRSFELNLECVVVVYNRTTARTLAKHHYELRENAHKVHLETWRKRSLWQSFLDSIARLTSALQ